MWPLPSAPPRLTTCAVAWLRDSGQPYDAGVVPDDAERINRLERQVRYLLRYAGLDPEIAAADYEAFGAGLPSAAASPEIVALVRDGKPIQAIKMYRQMTGAGLKESKDVIDGLRIDLGLARRR
jgi:large subunit ribosomal protein L7/L12